VTGPVTGSPPNGRGLRRTGVAGHASGAGRGWSVPAGVDLVARVVATDVRDGDLAIDGDPEALTYRRRAVVDRPWLWLRQVHGSEVVVLGADDAVDEVAGSEADAAVTERVDVVLAAQSADCATVALVGRPATPFEGLQAVRRRSSAAASSPEHRATPTPAGPTSSGVPAPALVPGQAAIGVVHAGWRGLEADVLGRAVAVMRSAGFVDVSAVLGPCIGAECYEFGEAELARVVDRVGSAAAGRTRDGRPALDLRLGVRAALDPLDVEVLAADQRCTACSTTARAALDAGRWAGGPLGAPAPEAGRGWPPDADRTSVPALHSHRARGDRGRQSLVVWLERPSLGDEAR
jgi:copper oxidase (laccase) domain-containing protein